MPNPEGRVTVTHDGALTCQEVFDAAKKPVDAPWAPGVHVVSAIPDALATFTTGDDCWCRKPVATQASTTSCWTTAHDNRVYPLAPQEAPNEFWTIKPLASYPRASMPWSPSMVLVVSVSATLRSF
ncbi:MAG: hypothetical protein FWF25_04455 [Propionibacteriaceae bacterium]|nr:hypothetical protein [Propionibacteriaceae bacterium]